mmetsp:Transcript_50160/g.73679  ORF Transcript_50160/g.73679 Transcript_50160/m.73679 type:complete len:84 (+) Transcript_50160:354-605(+)
MRSSTKKRGKAKEHEVISNTWSSVTFLFRSAPLLLPGDLSFHFLCPHLFENVGEDRVLTDGPMLLFFFSSFVANLRLRYVGLC